MLKINNYKKVTNIFITLLVSLKFITLVDQKINIIFFIFWSMPFVIFYFFSKKNSVKSYQSFCFILLIYFMSASSTSFRNNSAHIYDLTELILIVVFFIHCLYGPRILRS